MKLLENGTMISAPERTPQTLEERISALEDVRAIEEALYHYAWAVDMKNAQGVASCFTADGAIRAPGSDRALAPQEAIAKVYGKLLGSMTSSTHLLSNVQVQLVSATQAVAHAPFASWEGFHEALVAEDRFTFGRYEASLEKEADGQWRIKVLCISFAGQTGSTRFAEHLQRVMPPRPLEG